MAIHKIKIFSGRGSEYLAEKIAASFGTTLGQSEVLRFSDGEFQPCYNESIRGCTVFILSLIHIYRPTCPQKWLAGIYATA